MFAIDVRWRAYDHEKLITVTRPGLTSSRSEPKAAKNPAAAKKPKVQVVQYVQTVQVVKALRAQKIVSILTFSARKSPKTSKPL
jgi:hypothetical protein